MIRPRSYAFDRNRVVATYEHSVVERPTKLLSGQVWRLSDEVVIVVMCKRGDTWLVSGFACGDDSAMVFVDNRLMVEKEIVTNNAAEYKGLLSEM